MKNNSRGFTLVELMMVTLLSSLVAAGIYYMYTNQQNIYRRQEAVVDMQQNLRGGMYLIGQELRMAGYDAVGTAGAAITGATQRTISFTQDLDNDGALGGLDENVALVWDIPSRRITRDTGGGAQPFIDNVDFFELVYTLDDGTETPNPAAGFLDEIRTVQISMLVRSPLEEPNLVNDFLDYESEFGTTIAPFFDNFRRRMASTTIQCRNAGL